MYDEIYFLLQEYRWLVVFIVSISFRDICIKDESYIYTPQGYYWLGLATGWLIMYAATLGVG